MLHRTSQYSDRKRHYLERGITVCERWRSFETFHADMGECPDGYTLERKDNNSGYSQENCRWATMKEQNNNRRSNTFVEFNGERHTLAEWADITGIRRPTIYSRWQRGWPVWKMLTEPSASQRAR
jgi:hypothetical protein